MIASIPSVTEYRLREAADLLGVSDDTVRRWGAAGRLTIGSDASGRQVIDGAELAAFARAQAEAGPSGESPIPSSARNHLRGLVTRVVRDTVMAQVEMQCGPYRIVSLLSREAADELGLEPGVLAVASIKATNVVVELPKEMA